MGIIIRVFVNYVFKTNLKERVLFWLNINIKNKHLHANATFLVVYTKK